MPVTPETILKLMLRERIRLVAYITTIVGDRHHAEDLFQDLSVEALKKAETINDEDHLLGWLRTGARFRAIDHLRRQAARPLSFSPELAEKLDAAWEAAPHDDATDQIDALRDCLGELSPRARKMVELRYQDGLAGTELAERVKRTPNAVYIALSRIHKALGECVKNRLGRAGNEGGRS